MKAKNYWHYMNDWWERVKTKRILMISFRIPYPLTNGSKIRIYNIGKILTQRYRVDLLAINEGRFAHGHLERLEEVLDKVIVYLFQMVGENVGR